MALIYVVRLREEYVERDEDRHFNAPRLVRAFHSEEAAADHIRALAGGRAVAPAAINPFGGFWRVMKHGCADVVRVGASGELEHDYSFRGDIAAMSSLGEKGFLVLLDDLGVGGPTLGGQRGAVAWHRWWREEIVGSGPRARAAIWKALDRLSFFEVVPVRLEE